MQFFWLYIDDLMGKGLSIFVILELLFYVSASLIPLALPLAILLSSIMTLGNLSENNELTALKASGLSIYRILKPLTVVVLIIATTTFFFANYIIPVANLKLHSLIYDIQNKKMTSVMKPGTYSTELDGYAIKIDEGEGNQFKGILIHDATNPSELKTIRAESGTLYKTENGNNLFFELKNGHVIEELDPVPASYSNNGTTVNKNNSRRSRRSTFDQATFKIDLTGFDLSRSKDELFKDKHEMLNVFQIQYAKDSIRQHGEEVLGNFLLSFQNDYPYFLADKYDENSRKTNNSNKINLPDTAKDTIISFENLSPKEKEEAIIYTQTMLRNRNNQLKSQAQFLSSLNKDVISYMIEFHRKFALTFAIIVLFFIGAPLGAIVKKGGFGAPVVIAALLFMVYFVLLTVGENLATSGTVTPFVGMWFPALVLSPLALLFMQKAAKDRGVFDFSDFTNLFKKK